MELWWESGVEMSCSGGVENLRGRADYYCKAVLKLSNTLLQKSTLPSPDITAIQLYNAFLAGGVS